MVWAGVCYEQRTQVHFIDGILNAQRYRDVILSPIDSVFQFLPISSNFTQPLKRSGPTFYRPQSTTWPTLCEGDVLHFMRQIVVTPDTDWFSDPIILFSIYINMYSRVGFLKSFPGGPICHRVWLQPLSNSPTRDFLTILKTLISMLMCIWLGLEQNSAGVGHIWGCLL